MVLVAAAVVLLAGVGLLVAESGPEPRAAGETEGGGPLESVRWNVITAGLAAGDRTPHQLRAVGDHLVVAHGATIEAFDATTGAPLWSRPAHAEHVARDVGDAEVIVTVAPRPEDRYLLTAVDAATGVTIWRREVDAPQVPPVEDEQSAPRSAPGIDVTPGAVFVGAVAGSDDLVRGIGLHDGEELWVADLPGDLVHADASLAVLVEEQHDDEESITRFTVVDVDDGSTAWTARLPAGGIDVRPSARVVPDGPIVTADAASGIRGHARSDGEVIWERTDTRRGEFLALAAEEILVTQDRTRAYVGIDAADGFVRWRHDWLVPGPIAITTAAGRAIVVSADERVAALGLDHGTRTWEERLEAAGAVSVAGGLVVHADRRGRLSGRSVTTGRDRWSSVLTDEGGVGLAAVGDTVFTATQRGTTANHEVTAWVEGEQRWSAEVQRWGLDRPVVASGRLLVHGSAVGPPSGEGSTLTVLDAASGAELWTTRGAEPAAWLPAPTGAIAHGDRVVSVLPDRITVYELGTGTVAWEQPATSVTDPVLLDSDVVIGDGDGDLVAFDLTDGHEAWRSELSGDVLTLSGGDGRAYVVTAAGELVAVDGDGEELWTAPLPGVTHRPPVGSDEAVVVVVGATAIAFDPATGAQLWATPLPGPLAGPPVTAGDAVAVATTDGTVRLLGAEDGGTLDLFLLGPVHAGPVIASGTTYVVTAAGELVALGPRDPDDDPPSVPPIHPR